MSKKVTVEIDIEKLDEIANILLRSHIAAKFKLVELEKIFYGMPPELCNAVGDTKNLRDKAMDMHKHCIHLSEQYHSSSHR